MSSSEEEEGSKAKRQCLMPGTSRQPPEEAPSEEPFAPALEHYLVKTFDWKVSGYRQMVSSADKDDEADKAYYRRSPSFRFMGRTWYLHLYPNLPNMVVCLMLSGEGPGAPTRLHHTFGVRDIQGKVDWKIKAIGNFGAGTQNIWKTGNPFLSKEELVRKEHELVRDDAITIACQLFSDECRRFLRDFICLEPIVEKITRGLMRRENVDTLIILRRQPNMVNSKALRAKSQAKSPKFASLLVPGKTLKLDCDGVAFAMLIEYFESGQVCRMPIGKMLDLYDLAATYKVVGLRERCLACVTAWLDPGVVIEVLDFAKDRRLRKLVEVATQYLVSHAQQVLATSQWMELVTEDPKRANHFYRRIAERVAAAVCP